MHPKLIMNLKANKEMEFATSVTITSTTSKQTDLASRATYHKIEPNCSNPAADHIIVESSEDVVKSPRSIVNPDYEAKLRHMNMQKPSARPKSSNPNRKTDELKLAEDAKLSQDIMGYLATESKLVTQRCLELKNILTEIENYLSTEDNNKFNNNEDKESCKAGNSALSTNKYKKSKRKALEKKSDTLPKCKIINGLKMAPIGNGTTFISKHDYEKINWTSYTKATRCLLRAVFPRSVLATHSMTGKPSPAFKDKQKKMCLDSRKVMDIINEVRDKFHIQENLVRGIITITCADESKMWRNRQKKSQENISPKKAQPKHKS